MTSPRKAWFVPPVVFLGALWCTAGAGASGPVRVAANTGEDAGRSVGNAVDDSVITAKVKSALIADEEVKAFDISVKTRQGNVMLSGFVDNPSQARRAAEIARGVNGVRDVSNQLTVKN